MNKTLARFLPWHIKSNVEQAERAHRDVVRRWPEVNELANLARDQERENHLRQKVEAILGGRL